MVNIGDTARSASVQPDCDVSKRERLLTPGKPFYATLSPVRINNRKQQQSLAAGSYIAKALYVAKSFFLRHKYDTKITLAAIESAC